MAYLETIAVDLGILFFLRLLTLDLPQQIFGRNSLISWACRKVQSGFHAILMTPAKMFRDGAKEVWHSARRQPSWQQLIPIIFAGLLCLFWVAFWLPAKVIGRPSGKKK